MSEQILGVKLLKKGEKVKVTIAGTGPVASDQELLYKEACHPDLYNSVQALKSHFALLTNYIPIGGDLTAVALAPFEMTGFALNNKQDGVTLKGYRETDLGRTIPLNVLVKFKQDEANGYPMIKDLEDKLKVVDKETNKYRLEGKTLQLKLDLDKKEAVVTHAQIAEPDELAKFKTKDEWSADEYKKEVDNTTALQQGKVLPINKGGKKKVVQTAENPSGEVEYTPEMLEERSKKGGLKKNPNKSAAK